MIEPCASSTARLTMFSEAISSISCCCRPSSFLIAAAISGSALARLALKNELGTEALADLAYEVRGRSYPPAATLRTGSIGGRESADNFKFGRVLRGKTGSAFPGHALAYWAGSNQVLEGFCPTYPISWAL